MTNADAAVKRRLFHRIAEHLYGTEDDNTRDIECAERRLATYVESGQLEITTVADTFGLAGPACWAILHFEYDSNPICVPIPSL